MAEKQLWLTSLDAAKQTATLENKPILIVFSGSDWCIWCIRLEAEVFEKQEFIDYAKTHFVLLKLDFPMNNTQLNEERQRAESVRREYLVESFPTVIIAAADGTELARTGYQRGGAAEYVKHLAELLKNHSK